MRVREMQEIVARRLSSLPTTLPGEATPTGRPGARLDNVRAVREAVEELQSIPALSQYSAAVLQLPVWREPGEPLYMLAEHANQLQAVLTKLHQAATMLLQLTKSVLPPQAKEALAIKLPAPETVVDLEKTIRRIEHAFESPVRAVFNEAVRIQNFDTGSEWLEIVLASTLILEFVARLINIGHGYLKRQLEVEAVASSNKALGMSEQFMNDMREAGGRVLQAWTESETAALRGADDSELTEEARSKSLAAVKEIASLFRDQMEVHAALAARSMESSKMLPRPEETRMLLESSTARKLLTVSGTSTDGGEPPTGDSAPGT